MRELIVEATKEGMLEVMETLAILLQENRCPLKDRMQFDIAMEELLVNVVYYAYGEEKGDMHIQYQLGREKDNISLQVILIDEGIAYNPLEKEDPDISLSAENRQIGGLGIFMAKQFLDSINYERKEEKNYLYLKKNFIREKLPIEEMIYRYPQLTLEPGEGMSTDEGYLNIVRRGKLPENLNNPYISSVKDSLKIQKTIAGDIELLYLDNRKNFERFVQVLAYRCEDRPIPASMGAVTISNLNNWRKIEAHKIKYLQAGNWDWGAEFKRFTSKKENYKDTLVIAGSGCYSALSAEDAGFDEEDWLNLSATIRLYHEITHVVLQRMCTRQRDSIFEEVVADAMGIYKALGHYDILLAKKFLGIEQAVYREGGRLQNYLKPEQEIAQVRTALEPKMAEIEQYLNNKKKSIKEKSTDKKNAPKGKRKKKDMFDTLLQMYEELDIP